MTEIVSRSEIDHQQTHDILVGDFTDRYLDDSGMGKIAYSLPYDQSDPLCDYDKTWWQAKPNHALGAQAASFILGKMHRLSAQEIRQDCIQQFAYSALRISHHLREAPIMLINGHKPDLQAALASFACINALADNDWGLFGHNFKRLAEINHVIGTRGFAPVMIGRPNGPHKSLVSVAQWVMNPHLSFPNNQRMRDSALPREFRSAYNDHFADDCLEAIQAPVSHPKHYHTLWSTPPGGTKDVSGYDIGGNEIQVTAKVEKGTRELVSKMGCGLLPVYTHFGYGKERTVMSVGQYIPPADVKDDTLPNLMADMAEFRRYYGENTYYAEDAAVLKP